MKFMGMIQWGASIAVIFYVGYKLYWAMVKKAPTAKVSDKKEGDIMATMFGKPKDGEKPKDIFEVIK